MKFHVFDVEVENEKKNRWKLETILKIQVEIKR